MSDLLGVLRRPRWIVGTVICLAVVAAFLAAGLWQLRRLDERKDRNALIEARTSLPVDEVEDVVRSTDDTEELPFRRVVARGEYDADGQVRVRNRSLDGRPGDHVVTPLVLADGTAVAVNRGFVPRGIDLPATPDGAVEVEGLLQATQEREGIGPTDPADGRLESLNRLDLDRLQQQYDRELLPVSLQLESAVPPDGAEIPIALPEPERTEGPHLSYAVQWFLFAGVGIVGWPLLLRRVVEDDEGPGGGAERPAAPTNGSRPLEPAR